MDYLLLTYDIKGRSAPGQLILDIIGQRWNPRKVAHAIVRHEFPSLCPEKMQGREWCAEQVLERFGISNLQYKFVRASPVGEAGDEGAAVST